MAEKDINAKTEAQEAPASAVAIDGYEEVAKGGSKIWDKMKYHVARAMVVGATMAGVFGATNIKDNSDAKWAGMAVSVIVGSAVLFSIKNDKEDNSKTADFTKYSGRD